MNPRQFLRDWSLPIAMVAGVVMYLLYVNIPLFDGTRPFVLGAVAVVQPLLIFAMLFVTFCKIRYNELKPRRWHFILLAFQLGLFAAISLSIAFFRGMPQGIQVLLEAAMLCLLCPTATAAAVITAKLGGSASSLITYTMLINVAVALFAPLLLTLSHPVEGVSFLSSFLLIMGRVFPLLLFPLLCAELLRKYIPSWHSVLVTQGRNVPFYLWLVALSLAIAMTARSIANSNISLLVMAGIALVSLLCCLLQFAVGRRVAARYGERITGGQALGQKNTVFAIWLAYTFLTPVTAIAGGFYSLWHNIVNTRQLYRHNHKR
ncbi:MAG: transporter [Bacteroidaceae bacterium]|nr:transporter [Bacteroidaceae bacterium]